jgi:hypothetical protein
MGTIVEHCVPPLEAGDKLTRAEFLRRWEAQEGLQSAEHKRFIAKLARRKRARKR